MNTTPPNNPPAETFTLKALAETIAKIPKPDVFDFVVEDSLGKFITITLTKELQKDCDQHGQGKFQWPYHRNSIIVSPNTLEAIRADESIQRAIPASFFGGMFGSVFDKPRTPWGSYLLSDDPKGRDAFIAFIAGFYGTQKI